MWSGRQIHNFWWNRIPETITSRQENLRKCKIICKTKICSNTCSGEDFKCPIWRQFKYNQYKKLETLESGQNKLSQVSWESVSIIINVSPVDLVKNRKNINWPFDIVQDLGMMTAVKAQIRELKGFVKTVFTAAGCKSDCTRHCNL